jgi:hypothetical protein
MPVHASFGKTWDAVIDVYAFQNIPIRTLERASGFVAAEVATVERVPQGKKHPWADCGRMARGIKGGLTNPYWIQPSTAFYNVRVKGDSLRSVVQVTVNWRSPQAAPDNCSTKGVWESATEDNIRLRAEGDTSYSHRRLIRPNDTDDVGAGENSLQKSEAIKPTVMRQGASAVIGAPTSNEAQASAQVAFARGQSLMGNHEWAKAEQSFREALQFDGSIPRYHAALGSLLMTLKRWDEAEAEFSAAMLLDVDNAEYRRLLKLARSKR